MRYYLPVLKNEFPIGNIVVNIDYQKYFKEIFNTFNFQDYQWQWVVSDSGDIVYNNSADKLKYSEMHKIITGLKRGASEDIIHKAESDNTFTGRLYHHIIQHSFFRRISVWFSLLQLTISENT